MVKLLEERGISGEMSAQTGHSVQHHRWRLGQLVAGGTAPAGQHQRKGRTRPLSSAVIGQGIADHEARFRRDFMF